MKINVEDWNELEDDIVGAIYDSLDSDWTARAGARAVVALLKELANDEND